ncbi:hypothetical protein VR010_00080 [Actinomycetaceae bacterium L2_0104]
MFTPGLSLEGWFDEGTFGYERLLPIAEAAGDGSIAALWLDDEDQARVVVLASDGDGYVVAENARDFLTLLSIGYTEFLSFLMYGPPEDDEAVDAVAEFRAWAEETFDVEVPEEWPPVGDDDFSAWLDAQLGREQAAESSATPEVRGIEVTGDVSSLLTVLGEKDGADVAARIADAVGIELGDSLRSSAKALRAAGIEAESDRHGVATIWITVGAYPRPADLVGGIDASTTLEAARALLGEPEKQNEQWGWIRYVVDGRYINLTFDDGALSRVTLMVDAP